ncbi:MAG TPA: peptidylprolyl isomerase [Nitrospirota bacterium]|nr:peptidylprolyl isomerase [Nitrospirota bacterium]
MRKTVFAIIFFTSIFLLCSKQSIATASVVVDRVVAVVNNEIITLSDLQREAALKKTAGKPDERTLLEDMIDRKLEMAAAKRAGMDVTDKELADAIADIMKRNSFDSKQFETALAKDGLTLEQYKIELREQMTLSRMFNKYIRAGIAVDEAEVRAYYNRNIKLYTLPEEIRLRQIFFPIADNSTSRENADVKEKAEQIFARAKHGENFSSLVREFSEGATVSQDGDLGFTQRGSLLPEMEAAAQPLKPGDISPPFTCAGGYNIIRLEEVRTPVKPYEKVKDEIMNMLYQQKVENTYRSWLQSLRSDSNIENRL